MGRSKVGGTTQREAFRALLEPKGKKREYSLSVDEGTYEIITEVSKQTGKSRPKVLRSFVELAYGEFKKACTP